VARHNIPDDGVKHIAGRECPCQPVASKGRDDGVIRTIYTHQETRKHPEMPELHDRLAVGDDEFPEADCGHIVVDVDGDRQHHNIPDDGNPHAPTTECGCGPQRVTAGTHVVFEHVDQERGAGTDDIDY
jgi:hypothetical protein